MQDSWLYNARTIIDLLLIVCALVLVLRWSPSRGKGALTLGLALLAVAPAGWWVWSYQVERGIWEAQGQEASLLEALTLAAQTGGLVCLCVFAARMRRELKGTSGD
jgi:hypothetical protein